MGGREGAVARGRLRARSLLRDLGGEVRAARLQHGLSQTEVGLAVGLSGSQVGRLERGLVPAPDTGTLGALCAAVGLDLALRVHPAGEPLRDAAHLALLARFRSRLHPSVRWRIEVPLPIPGDRRTWDGELTIDHRRIGVELETRPRDLQELCRRLTLKARDGEVDAVILVLADTRHDRALVRLHADEFAALFPIQGRRALELLAAGVHPGGNALVLL